MRDLLFFSTLLLVAPAVAGHAQELACRKGGPSVTTDYMHAINLIQSGERLSVERESEIVRALEGAVINQCQQAALVLAEIKINQAAAFTKGSARQIFEKLDDEIYKLLLEAGKIGEGQFQLGSLYLTKGSKYYSPTEGLQVLQAAAKAGDQEASAYLVDIYENGVAGIEPDRAKADCWKAKIK